MNVLDLFSGIGGFSLGLERAGMTTAAFCEIESFPRQVLATHWPEIPVYDDVRCLTAKRLAADGVAAPDIVCGGFPCQDISLAGQGVGLDGERSGLFFELARVVQETCPRWVFLENVAALRSRGLDRVLGSLAEIGYSSCWNCIPASAIGAPHRRDRIWIVAHRDTNGDGKSALSVDAEACGVSGAMAHSSSGRRGQEHQDAGGCGQGGCEEGRAARSERSGAALAHADDPRLAFWQGFRRNLQLELETAQRGHHEGGWWASEPDVGRVVDGIPARLDGLSPGALKSLRRVGKTLRDYRNGSLRALGNSIVPQIAEIHGRAIMRMESR